ncbi:WD40 domain-containing protein [Encephalitozoon hellem]|uniref:WD40 domain-containing protein n=1 Tax=Encephalitozoon hellem TaxID=27973 RepID=A0ABY8CJ91_ENCHE|nr:WD40 domain-containing protein [Encephalitozoon hellem]
MILKKVVERKLNGAPTSLHLTESKIYVSLKKRYIIETEYNALKLRRVPVKENVRTIVGCEECIFLFSDKGSLYILLQDRSIRNGSALGKKIVNTGLYDQSSGNVVVGTSRGKALVFTLNLEICKTFYETPSGMIDLSVSDVGKVACIYEIDPTVRIFDLKHSEVKSMKIPSGFPQAVAFVNNTHFVVGNDAGEVYLADMTTMSIIHSSTMPQVVTTLVWKDGFLFIGGEDSLYLSSVTESSIDIIDSYKCNGFVNAICLNGNHIVMGVGKEPKLGRWKVKKDGEHKLVVLRMG